MRQIIFAWWVWGIAAIIALVYDNWGWAIGKAYGEPFFAREEIGLADMTPLLG